jgi:diguanylate cyclase (GGDEF)-like protein
MFKLSRYFSIASFFAIIAVVTVLSIYYRSNTTDALMAHQTRSNVSLATAFVNSVWPRYADFVRSASNIPEAELPQRAEVDALRADVLTQMKGLNVVKVKIYNLDGLTVFSTDPKQIGVDKSENTGFQKARRGDIASSITFRNEFYAFERVIVDRNLVTSYIPVRKADGTVEAVFELYSDVTDLVEELNRTQTQIIVMVSIALGLLYLFLYLIVRRADKIINTQDQERRENEDRVRYQAYHDPMTGLPNRVNFNERLSETIARAKRSKNLVGLLYLDLDRFKVVNDSLGHDAGDQLLRLMAKRIQSVARESDMVFRMGGDEFTVILENLSHAEDATRVAQRLIKSIGESVQLVSHKMTVTASIGIAIYPSDATDVDGLVKGADAAMYRAKQAGRNTYTTYTADLNVQAIERFALEGELQQALKNGEFVLYYQPKVALPEGQIVGMEALLRWNHQRLDLLAPDKFLSILEDTGLIVPVGEWVIRTACKQNKLWQDAGLIRTRISVNVSPSQFRDKSLVTTVREILNETGLEPRFLELELTESLLIEDTHGAIEMMNKLKDIGVFLSIDDFGSGYSSLNYLNRFPVDILKIDRTFVSNLITDSKDAEITHAIASLAHALKLGLIAEGVENKEQLEFLQSHGCDEAQGFLFSEPVPAEEFGRLLAAEKLSDSPQESVA